MATVDWLRHVARDILKALKPRFRHHYKAINSPYSISLTELDSKYISDHATCFAYFEKFLSTLRFY